MLFQTVCPVSDLFVIPCPVRDPPVNSRLQYSSLSTWNPFFGVFLCHPRALLFPPSLAGPTCPSALLFRPPLRSLSPGLAFSISCCQWTLGMTVVWGVWGQGNDKTEPWGPHQHQLGIMLPRLQPWVNGVEGRGQTFPAGIPLPPQWWILLCTRG